VIRIRETGNDNACVPGTAGLILDKLSIKEASFYQELLPYVHYTVASEEPVSPFPRPGKATSFTFENLISQSSRDVSFSVLSGLIFCPNLFPLCG